VVGQQWHSGSALKDRHNVNQIQVLEPSLPQITMISDNEFNTYNPSLMHFKATSDLHIMPPSFCQPRSDMHINSSIISKVDRSTNLNRATILIVDDEKFNCDIIYGFLMILQVPNRKEICEFAYNGQQALEKIEESV